MLDLSTDALIVLGVISLCFGALMLSRWPADAILVGSVVVLLLFNIITPQEALAGMANEGMVAVGALYVVAKGLAQTGVVSWVSQAMLGRPKSTAAAQARLMVPVAVLSSVLNNTPVVAMMVPAVSDWAKRNQLAVSYLMIPLSYAAIIGGTCTLVGTSTNLVVNGMLMDIMPARGLGIFDLAWVGVPASIAVIAFTVAFSRWLLPNRASGAARFEDARQYIVEMQVEHDSPLIGLSIEDAGLRQLPGMFLIEIQRGNRLITAVSPTEVLMADDHLIFAGDVRSVIDLKNFRGLRMADDQVFKLNSDNAARCLVEVVISPNFPFLDRSVKEMGFRNHYGAVIIAMARNGAQIKSQIGGMALQPGDTLLLETHDEFAEQQAYSKDFLLVRRLENSKPVLHERRYVALAILLAMVFSVSFGWLSMLKASLIAGGAMVATRCLRVQEARQSIDWQVLLVIAASIALGGALLKTGAAEVIAGVVTGSVAGSPMASLGAIFLLTAVFSAIIANIAAAVLLFPIALAVAQQLGVDPQPFVVTLMLASSACFATPIGYQTNLMVYGPGNYRFVDFVKIGVPVTLLVGVITVFVAPLIWRF